MPKSTKILLTRLLLKILRDIGNAPNARNIDALHLLPRVMTPVHGNTAITARQHTLQRLLDAEDIYAALIQQPPSLPKPYEGRESSAGGKKKRIRHLVEQNCPARALRLIESDGCAPCTPAVLRDLFPERSRADDLPANLPHHEIITISAEEVTEGISKLPRCSAAGQSGWTYDAIKTLSYKNADLINAITRIANRFLTGTPGPVENWMRDRALGLRKPDGGTRPIVIGEPWARLFHRLINSAVATRAAAALQPHQWGIGVKGGPETIAHACRIFRSLADHRDLPCAIQTIDIKNAYNTIRRSAIGNAVANRLPVLARWLRWAYAAPSPLLTADGSTIHMCGTGVKQGDPLASVLFCLGIQSALDTIRQRFPRCVILADMDDITVLGPAEEMPALVNAFELDVANIGLSLNRAKCHQMNLDTTEQGALEGLRIMGAYIGAESYQRRQLTEDFDRLHATLDRIVTEEPAVALPIAKYCVNARPIYIARTMRPEIIHHLARAFDDHVDTALLRIAGHPLNAMPHISSSLRTLRVTEGGLGMHRISDIKEAAFTASLTSALANLFQVLPTAMRDWHSQDVITALQDELHIISGMAPEWVASTNAGRLTIPSWPDPSTAAPPGADPMLVPDPIEVPETPLQRTLCVPIREQTSNAINMALQGDRRALAWWRSGSFPNAGAWMRVTPLATLNLAPSEYRTALSLRLLLPARGTPEGAYLQCGVCGNADKVHDYRYHALNCTRTGDIRSQRHTAVKHALADMLVALFGSASVAVETPLGPNLRAPDIILTVGNNIKIIDTCIINPTADRYGSRGAEPPPAGHAASMAEHRKRTAYAASLAARNLAPETFVPFAVETTGRLGPAATCFVESLEQLLTAPPQDSFADVIAFHLARIRIAVQRGNARAFSAFAPHLQTRQGTPPGPPLNAPASASSSSVE